VAGTARGVGESPYSHEQWASLEATAAPARPPRSLSERIGYPSFIGIAVTTLLIAIPVVSFVAVVVDVYMILRYVFGYRAPGSPQWSVHRPSPTSLVVVWVVAVCTVVVYPLAVYMTLRFIAEYRARRRIATKACPRCAETIKAAALVCRYCGQTFDPSALPPPPPAAVRSAAGATSAIASASHTGPTTGPISTKALLLIGVAAAVVVIGVPALLYLGNQVSPIVQTVPGRGQPGATAGTTTTSAWPPSGFSQAGVAATLAYRWLPQGDYDCAPSQQYGCKGIEVRWQGQCTWLAVTVDTFDSTGQPAGVASQSGAVSGSRSKWILTVSNSRAATASDVPRITCR